MHKSKLWRSLYAIVASTLITGHALAADTSAPVDTDNDGIPDSADACANTPAATPVDERGCEIDTDKDGVVDSRDFCPDTTASLAVNADGCPIPETTEQK